MTSLSLSILIKKPHKAITNDINSLMKATRDGSPYRVRYLVDVYLRCRMVVVEPSTYIKACKSFEWVTIMDVEIGMVKKNNT